jgi:two-component system CheB/CheR fusion protein
MNEELQSTNEELQTINDELRDRTDDLDHANAFLEGVFASLGRAVVVVDRALRVTVWNSDAQDLWGLRREEVEGGSFLALEIGLPVGELRPLLRACLDGGEAGGIVLDAVTRRGKAIRCAVSCAPLTTGEERAGVIVTMEPEGSAPE